MAGRIREDDITAVRERARIDEVVREHVTLVNAGGGSLKGLCPFHDERTPSFHVTPSKGFWFCFGCNEGGDVLDFVMRAEHLSFAESVEKLAARVGITLRYVEGGPAPAKQQGQRSRLVEANALAAAFFVAALRSPEAAAGRAFLAERDFDDDAVEMFGVGYAPKSWDALINHLRQRGFAESELVTAGLVAQGARGTYDRFRGRLIWPIRDTGGDVIGFGARRLYDDDDGPKYLNTPETPLYRKSHVLYGIDLARKEIARSRQAVIVEGYTDVMACHLSGVTTAIATCGTAFGAEHIRILRRFLADHDEFRGEVVFTFDGDAAGQKAAMRAFAEDQRFVASTFVAVEKSGADPCELRQRSGPEAVRALVAARVPLFEFAIRSQLAGHDLNRAEGRVAALRAAAPAVAGIRDRALQPEYIRLLAGWLGMDIATVSQAVRSAPRTPLPSAASPERPSAPGVAGPGSGPPPPPPPPGRGGRAPVGIQIEREALKAVLQRPEVAGAWFDQVEQSAFSVPAYAAVQGAVLTARETAPDATERAFVEAVLNACVEDGTRLLVRGLAVEPLRAADEHLDRYAVAIVARLQELAVGRQVADLRGRLQRADPESPDSATLLAELLALDTYQRQLREVAQGAGG